MGGQRVTNMATPLSDSDAATKEYINNQIFTRVMAAFYCYRYGCSPYGSF